MVMGIDVQELQRLFPSPVVWNDLDDREQPGQYSVGGALVMATAGITDVNVAVVQQRFPNEEELGEALTATNNTFLKDADQMDLADAIAYDIVTKSDTGNFSGAWEALGKALKWDGSDPRSFPIVFS